jgi:hypothetical protein
MMMVGLFISGGFLAVSSYGLCYENVDDQSLRGQACGVVSTGPFALLAILVPPAIVLACDRVAERGDRTATRVGLTLVLLEVGILIFVILAPATL